MQMSSASCESPRQGSSSCPRPSLQRRSGAVDCTDSELGRHKSLVLTNMESGIGRGRGRGRGVSGSEVIERVDLRRPHVPPPQVSQAAPPVGIRQTSEGTAATPGKRRTQVLRKSGRR